MTVAVFLVAAAAAVDARASSEHLRSVLLAVNEEAASSDTATEAAPPPAAVKLEHIALEKTPRGETVVINAKVQDPSKLFTPLVFARKSGTARYEAFTMRDRGRGGFQARLPPSILSEGSFEYFVEAQHEDGPASRLGSPRKPFTCVAFDPPPQPVAVRIRTAEPGASVRIDDNDAGKTPITVRLLPGRHIVSITGVDGRSSEQQIDVRPGKKQIELPVDLPQQPGGPTSLSVVSDPPDANVIVDGALVGRSPYQGALQAGDHLVAVELDGHQRRERRIQATEGRDTALSFALIPLPKRAALSVDSEPNGALVLVDGKERGRTPLVTAMSPGRHEILLQKPGRRDVGTEIEMPADQDLSVRLDLAPADRSGSRLTVTSTPRGAVVSVDGAEVGITPWSAETRPGRHGVVIAMAGFLKDERTVQIHMDRDTVVDFAPRRAAGPATLHVETEPPATLRVDGKELGETPLTAEVPPGEHQLEVTLDGYKTVAQQVTVDAGQGVSVRVPLQRAQLQDPPLIAVSSDPAGAQIYLDQKLVGATPVRVRTTPGPHEVRLVLDGYVTRVTRPVLPPDREFELRIAVVLTPVSGQEQKRRAPTADELFEAQIASAHACSVKGDLECALAGYRTAYQQRPNPRILFNIAQLRRKLGRYDEAAASYRSFLAQAEKPGRGAPPKELIAEAKLQLANCERQMLPSLAGAPASVMPAPAPLPLPIAEDTVPPKLSHVPLRTARRGQPVRLVATITDDRSGIGLARACWRNAYGRDFECHAMGNVGGDDYGVEVPARAVTDLFAYYLEAWDTAENGPTRSGAPELPHAVVIDEPPQAVVTPAVAVATPPGGATRYVAYPVAPLLPPEVPGPTRPYDFSTGRTAPQPWRVTLFIGGERSDEQYTDSTFVGRLGLQGTYRFAAGWIAALTGDWRSSQQQYVPFNGSPGQRVSVDENRFDFAALAGYDLGELLPIGDRLELSPIAGGSVILARNDGFSFDLVGPSFGLRAVWSFEPFAIVAAGTYTYNLNKDSGSSASRAPVWAYGIRAGLQYRVSSAYTIELDYAGDGIKFDDDSRIANGAVFGFSRSF